MEIKLIREFDFNDKGSLFGQMDNMNDAIVKEIRESGKSLFIALHELEAIEAPSGEAVWPYKELEIEYEYAENNRTDIYVREQNSRRWTISELLDWANKKKAVLEMNDWLITAGGVLLLKLLAHPKDMQRKFFMTDVEIRLLPQKITYRWMS